jgi:hypothetical protein
MALHYLGIRHHGPGSAKNVKEYLEKIKPDIILLEGPPEAESILQWAAHTEMKPPVAILAYVPDELQRSLFFPFVEFSPEWQAILYSIEHKIPLRFMDLPVSHKFALEKKEVSTEDITATGEKEAVPYVDPFSYFAEIAGHYDGEKWWENFVEHRSKNEDIFEAVAEAVSVLREELSQPEKPSEQYREAWMRKVVKQAEKEMYNDIVVICGAWHVPALKNLPKQKDDAELLRGLPKLKVECTWIPWSYSRLSFASGYGAGIHSPGWYKHLWKTKKDVEVKWLTKVARLFRKKQIDISSAHIIETVRLAETLASLRGYSSPGLEELNEAVLSVMCMGEEVMLSLVHHELIVGPGIGSVPLDSPKPPLQVDIEKIQKQLRLPVTEEAKEIVLDLREERDLAKSVFLHRLSLLGINWGHKRYVTGKGTFKEAWLLQWDPAYSIDIIDRGSWGNSVEVACENYISFISENKSLREISDLLANTLLADISGASEFLLQRINALAAASADVIQLMEVLPSLVSSLRYGNVRNTDAEMLRLIVNGLVARICISLPNACQSVDDDSAQTLLDLFSKLNDSIALLQQEDQMKDWHKTLNLISENKNTSPIISGYTSRLVYDYKLLSEEAFQKTFSLFMSSSNEYANTASWLEGFLKGSGTILLLDEVLWKLIHDWVNGLDDEQFVLVLPLLRRTFSQFTQPERKKLGEKVRSNGSIGSNLPVMASNLDHTTGMRGLSVVQQLLGIN